MGFAWWIARLDGQVTHAEDCSQESVRLFSVAMSGVFVARSLRGGFAAMLKAVSTQDHNAVDHASQYRGRYAS